MCDYTSLSWRHPVLALSSPKPVWLMLSSIFYWWSAHVCINQNTASKMLTWFMLRHFKDNCLCWPSQAIVICLSYVNIYGVVSPLASSCMYCGMERAQRDRCATRLPQKKQKLIQEALPAVPFFQGCIPNYFLWVHLPFFFSLLLHTHTLLILFYFEGK